jgi:hypothetical protein
MAKVSRLLVIDASVLRSAGNKLGHSAHCARVLTSILEICHRAVICPEIQKEWNEHQSRISTKWRAAMNARKQLVKTNISDHQTRLTNQVQNLPKISNVQRSALAKDVHLLAAAAHADHIVVSGDGALKSLCDAYLTEPIEWLLALNSDSESQRGLLLMRLIELAKSKPFPSLP